MHDIPWGLWLFAAVFLMCGTYLCDRENERDFLKELNKAAPEHHPAIEEIPPEAPSMHMIPEPEPTPEPTQEEGS